ncbi:D-alanyl-D-alanine carboxypeptidase (penicillin-binding protein 5/6) [Kibdelosporangium banguiense]|uniref:D-alanyl-D-alanine carboxypeptidase (Penicillin-binding protein 5/6) n=1 Tax=Kibdelosporangium banguiense TaxID=1365924 RepID=A0ABS4TEC2_9PSEU|nr:D-alanyl-D-alanine carboxypeptidase (penicillin-binding protein 5/6) [Kibdelosporangium banguiense]
MVLTSRRLFATLFAVLCLIGSAGFTAVAQPGTPCPNKTTPPPPVDTSEKPKPGEQSPGPVPVPDKPVGGARMGECGVIAPQSATAPPADVTSASWLLADLDSGNVIGAKDPHARHRPASLIKVLLAIVVMKDLKMDTVVTGTSEDANQDGTRVGMGAGGQYTVQQLFQALLMHSGNDAAHALAVQLGSVDKAVQKMNDTAHALGAMDTHTATPSGLDGPGMMTSAYDMALFYREAMKHPEFATAITTKQIDWPGYGNKPGFKVNNDNRLLGKYDGFLGGKTGFTDDARHTYLGGAEQNGRRLVVVLMRGEQAPVKMADQGGKLLTWGFGLPKVQPVGTLNTPKPAAATDDNPDPAASVSTGGTSTAAPVKPISNQGGILPTAAMSIAAVTILGFLIWRIRLRYARRTASVPPETDPEKTMRIDPIRD